MQDELHEAHLPEPSRWPILTAIGVLLMPIGLIALFAHLEPGRWLIALGAGLTGAGAALWWSDLVRETAPGLQASRDVRVGMAFFIVSEVAFFGAFFAYYFHARLQFRPWPPPGQADLGDLWVPALNTVLLVTSGLTYTWGEWGLLKRQRKRLTLGLLLTVLLGGTFLAVQGYEWAHVPVTLSGGVAGTSFFLLTGFHGAHVVVGLVFVLVNLIRASIGHFTPEHHTGLQVCGWYWHFVDVVWLLLFAVLYVL